MKLHPELIAPNNLDSKVWRYIDFSKYVSMLINSSIYFTRADKFDDKFEGWPTKAFIDGRNKVWDEFAKKYDEYPNIGYSEYLREYTIQQKKSIGISCWHWSEYESIAMWRIYLKSNEGIVIQTTFRKLNEELSLYKEDEIFCGMVEYLNYQNDINKPSKSKLSSFMNKRESFEFEHEMRCVFERIPINERGRKFGYSIARENIPKLSNYFDLIDKDGVNVKVNLNNIIESIVVSPFADNWFTDIVKAVTKKYGYGFNVEKSLLAEEPDYM
jgi:hypothetical protein